MKQSTRNLIIAVAVTAVAVIAIMQFVRKEVRDTTRETVRETAADAAREATEGAVQDTIGDLTGILTGTTERRGDEGSDSTESGDDPGDPDLVGSVLGGISEGVGNAIRDTLEVVLPPPSQHDRADEGRRVYEAILAESTLVTDPRINGRVQRLGAEVLDAATERLGDDMSGLNFTFTVLESEIPNAFAHIGGYIYVNRGLLDLLQTDEQLKFVLAHEIGHVECNHTCQYFAAHQAGSEFGGDMGAQLASIGFGALQLNYSSNQELEADAFGARTIHRLGIDRRAATETFRLLETGRSDAPVEIAEPANAAEAVVVAVENHFRTHPPAAERIEEVERLDVDGE